MCLSGYLFVCLCVCLVTCLSVFNLFSFFLSFCPLVCLSSVCLTICLLNLLSVFFVDSATWVLQVVLYDHNGENCEQGG